jgi:mRNA interferase MazF
MTTPSRPIADNIKRGDVVLVPFPNSDLQTAKLRPGLVVQADDLNTGLHQVIIAMISSNLDRAGHPSRTKIELETPMGIDSGLLLDSVIMTDNLATISLSRIVRVIGTLRDMTAVDDSLRQTLKL